MLLNLDCLKLPAFPPYLTARKQKLWSRGFLILLTRNFVGSITTEKTKRSGQNNFWWLNFAFSLRRISIEFYWWLGIILMTFGATFVAPPQNSGGHRKFLIPRAALCCPILKSSSLGGTLLPRLYFLFKRNINESLLMLLSHIIDIWCYLCSTPSEIWGASQRANLGGN